VRNEKGVERPSPAAIARWLAVTGTSPEATGGAPDNFERNILNFIASALEADPPDIVAAREAAEDGVAHAWRGFYEENRPEAWRCAAIAALLK
jgi:hypothetical protein